MIFRTAAITFPLYIVCQYIWDS